MSDIHFYQHLDSFSNFEDLAQSHLYQEVPEDWSIIITDIKGSTQAIEAGRYRDVNLIGVASIVAATQAFQEVEIPFVFGGDGTTFVVPEQLREPVLGELSSVSQLAMQQYQLDLRVGCVPVSEIHQRGSILRVAKFGLVPKRSLAVFIGGGLSLADSMIKQEFETYGYRGDSSGELDLSNLSCRWQPIPAKQGQVVSIIALAQQQEQASEVYTQLIKDMQDVIGGDLEQANPVESMQMKYKSLGEMYRDESNLFASRLNWMFIKRLISMPISILIFGTHWFRTRLVTNYSRSLKSHSDYRKFDDALRTVLDLSTDQQDKIVNILQGYYEAGQLYYGTHSSDEALMTCFVSSFADSDHLHFIDGGGGGYALAANQLKNQMKS